jgi:hypothetical protein
MSQAETFQTIIQRNAPYVTKKKKLLISCVLARQFWFSLLQHFQLQELAPQLDTTSFMDWWRRVELALGSRNKGLNLLIILGAWILWKHRNRCMFNGAAPSLAAAITQADVERSVWEMAGAKGIKFLMAQLPGT